MTGSKSQSLSERLRRVFADSLALPLAQVTEDFSFGDNANWNRTSNRKLLSTIEIEFGIEIDADERQEMISFRNVLAVVASHLPEEDQ